MSDHEQAGAAIRSYLTGAPKPAVLKVPPPDWGAAVAAGSANIPLMFAVAAYCYGSTEARRALVTLGDLSRTRFMLSEPLSPVYGAWHVLSWTVALDFAIKRGHGDVAGALRPLVTQYLGLCALMATRCPSGNLDNDEAKYRGKRIVAFAGCRAWGHHHGLGFGFHSVYRCAVGEEIPKGDSWETLAIKRCLPLLREIAGQFAGKSLDEIIDALPQYGMREDFEFRAYADGSRVCIMGSDETEFDDEDDNGNTLGFLLVKVDHGTGRVESYPEHPAPNLWLDRSKPAPANATRIRQTSAAADIDRHPSGKGWRLLHSLIGRAKADGYWETDIAEPTAPLIGAWRAPKDREGGWERIDGEETLDPSPMVPPDPVAVNPPSKRKGGCMFLLAALLGAGAALAVMIERMGL